MDFHLVALRIDLDVTRLQLAGEGAGQSPASGDHAVERRRCGTVARANAVDEAISVSGTRAAMPKRRSPAR